VDLDKRTTGFQPSDLIIIAGRPSMGKTAFCLNIACYESIDLNKTIAVFSLEMSKEQMVLRCISSEARVDAQNIRTGFLADRDWPRLTMASERLSGAPLFIDDTPALTVLDMRAKARRLKANQGLDLIIVDYLQLMRGRGDEGSREQEISNISRSLKALAKELNVPVIALSQLNRSVETRGKDKRPMLSDLRESGAIEQDADVILFIYREEVYTKCECPADMNCVCGNRGKAEVIIGKQRNGPIGKVDLSFMNTYTRFENAATNNYL
jgi:replicative DNA helicase